MAIAEPQFEDLYRELILDHYRRPRNRGELAAATARAHGLNPVCGDEVSIDLRAAEGRIEEICFRGEGCSISQASASMLTERVRGGTLVEARQVSNAFAALLTGEPQDGCALGDLEALEGVAKFPVRVKCALLSSKVLEDALAQAARSPQEAS